MSHQGTTTPRSAGKKSGVTTLVSVFAGLGLLVLLAFAFFSPKGGRPQQGDSAPDFDLTLLDGAKISLSDLRGQVVVLNFWASWCGPCRVEAPALQEVWEMYEGKGVVFLGVSHKDAEDASRAFVEEFGLTYLNGVDPRGRISRAYGVTGVPETFILDPAGEVVKFFRGEVQASELAQQLAQIMGQ